MASETNYKGLRCRSCKTMWVVWPGVDASKCNKCGSDKITVVKKKKHPKGIPSSELTIDETAKPRF